MFWLILTFIVAEFGVFTTFDPWDFEDGVWDFIFGIIVSVPLCLMTGAIMYESAPVVEATPSETSSKIVSVAQKDGFSMHGEIHGGAFLVSGYIDGNSEMHYALYKDVGDGIVLDKLPANRTTIKYSDGEPHLVTTSFTCPELKLEFWGFSAKCTRPEDQYTLYVPQGSIAEEIKLSL